MVVERFCQDANLGDEVAEKIRTHPDRHKDLLGALGLNTLARHREKFPDDVALVFGELSQEELRIWLSLLETRYVMGTPAWEGYVFDEPPEEVLQEIRLAHVLGFFHDIEIWTPERQHPDPMAVGVIYADYRRERRTARFFPIVRWGESLQPFEQIKELVQQRWAQEKAEMEHFRQVGKRLVWLGSLVLATIIVLLILYITLWQ